VNRLSHSVHTQSVGLTPYGWSLIPLPSAVLLEFTEFPAYTQNDFRNIAQILAEHHQFQRCWTFAGPDVLNTKANVISKQNNTFVQSSPNAFG